MATTTRTKTLYYRRCIWQGPNQNLEKHLRRAHQKLQHTNDRAFTNADVELQRLKVQSRRGGGLLLHIATYEPHQPASVVPFPSQNEEQSTELIDPPQRNNFMEGEIFVYVVRNDVLLLSLPKTRSR